MYKYLILILLSLAIVINSCGNKDTEEVQKQEQVNQEATDNFDALGEEPKVEDKEEVADMKEETSKTVIEPTEDPKALAEAEAADNSTTGDYSKKPLEGQIIVVSDLATGNFRKLTKDIAKDLVAKGEILAVKAGDKIYMVYNEDASLASKKLAGYANNSVVLMTGKAKVIDGINIFIVNLMEGR